MQDFYFAKNICGYDINGDNIVDFSLDEVSGGQNKIKQFTGKKLQDILANEEEITKKIKNDLKETTISEDDEALKKLYPIEVVAKIQNWPEYSLKGFKSYYGDYVSFDNSLFFRADKDNKVTFDPEQTGVKNAINLIEGCSFATPRAGIKDLKEKYKPD